MIKEEASVSEKTLVGEHETLALPFQPSPRESENELGYQGKSQRGGITGEAVSSPLNLVGSRRGYREKGVCSGRVRVSMEATKEGLENNGLMRHKNKSSRENEREEEGLDGSIRGKHKISKGGLDEKLR
ncbi:hypothetical protein V8G54_011232 [Vigna mungo]|uniref:Uncharacterized protein n=1 Tax=Vigna mungo TaxID=3915 RepID=A0AAQ3S2Q9_VIGMU